MGSRDDHFLDDERADALMRRVLARVGEPTLAAPPSDLVTSTARRLPAEPPALAARLAARRRVARLALSALVVGLVALVALVGLVGTLGGDPRLALLFGDGANGLDRKSTRLNSSHLGISYAVFCLKKKKTNLRSRRRGIFSQHISFKSK